MNPPIKEQIFTAQRLRVLQNTQLTPMSLTSIHRYLFNMLYPWTGQIRTTDLWKGQSFHPNKGLYEKIISYTETIQKHIRNLHTSSKLIPALAEDYAILNFLHPFQEGNGRTQREFLRQNLMSYGLILDLNPTSYKEMLNASIQGCKHNFQPFKKIFSQCILPHDNPINYYKQLPYLAILSDDDITTELKERIRNERI